MQRGLSYVVVESPLDGGWDWVAWSDDGSRRQLRGRSQTRGQAVQAAEHGAELLRASPTPGPEHRELGLQPGLGIAMS